MWLLLCLLFVILIICFLKSKCSDGYTRFQDPIDSKTHRVCRCIPYHHKTTVADGQHLNYIKCPSGTRYAGQEYWCTEANPECMDIACNYMV